MTAITVRFSGNTLRCTTSAACHGRLSRLSQKLPVIDKGAETHCPAKWVLQYLQLDSGRSYATVSSRILHTFTTSHARKMHWIIIVK